LPGPRLTWWLSTAAGVALLVTALAFVFAPPMPPRTVVMATGPEGGAYAAFGQKYKEILRRQNLRLELLATTGSVENIERLRDSQSGVSVAFVQGGTTSAAEAPELVSLGTLFYEPFWVFSRVRPQNLPGGRTKGGMRVSFGPARSGTNKLAHELAAAMGVDLDRTEVLELGPADAGEQLLNGDLDLISIVAAWDAPIVRRLLLDHSVQLRDWPRADAHAALRPYLTKLVLPRGVADLASDRPPEDVRLLAAKASLVVRADLHPALHYLLLEAASEVHGGPGVFNRAGDFPAAEPVDLPLSESAREYYHGGRPFLQRYLPFWLAALASRLLLLLIPVVGILYPLFRLLPAAYGWGMQYRIYRLYGELKVLEMEFDGGSGGPRHALDERLGQLERRADRMRVPLRFAPLLYNLKMHIGLVRERVKAVETGRTPAPSADDRH
jgi:TRAP-type uncharacterized transport system substrate-binding protein